MGFLWRDQNQYLGLRWKILLLDGWCHWATASPDWAPCSRRWWQRPILWSHTVTAEEPGYGSTITEGDVNTDVYINILPTSLLDTLEYCGLDRKSFRFQQDNATPHTSVPTKQWFQRQGFPLKLILDWPSQSPDLNPIEHVWNQQKRRLNAYPARATTIAELEATIHQEQYKFTKENCLKCIDSMSNRIKAVIRGKGGPTRCWTFSYI